MSQREKPLSFGGRLRSVRQWWWIGGVCCALLTGSLTAADVKDLQALYQKGDYQECLRLAKSELEDNNYSQAWRLILIQAQLAVGDYEGANAAITEAIDRFPRNIPLRWYAYRMAADRGEPALAEQQLKAIDEYAGPRIRYLQEPETLTFLGRAVLQMGAEPKLVLDNFLLRARQLDPKYADAWLAAGELALAKHDFELAARTFEDGLKEAPEHPDLLHGLARAYAPSDRAVMVASLSKALEQNTNHVPSRLLIADHLIDAEEYEKA
ncbi:MAG TPA: hypothetical protein VLD18_00005, partial [Verrucomicrobiae bacterium]|nr:hypothetical protein [Verrucomicrobiae bacterium]